MKPKKQVPLRDPTQLPWLLAEPRDGDQAQEGEDLEDAEGVFPPARSWGC